MEYWKDCYGFEKFYEVSNTGKVRNKMSKKILKGSIKYGYLNVGLYDGEKEWTKTVHRLIALTFIENNNNLPVVNHIDGNKQNNNVSNLEWCTISYNTKHAYINNLGDFKKHCLDNCKRGTETHSIKVYAFKNEKYIGHYNSCHECAKELGISAKTIYNRLKNKYSSRTGYDFKEEGDLLNAG